VQPLGFELFGQPLSGLPVSHLFQRLFDKFAAAEDALAAGQPNPIPVCLLDLTPPAGPSGSIRRRSIPGGCGMSSRKAYLFEIIQMDCN
jgi:hypothetical protein